MSKSRATELADKIEAATMKRPENTGTKIEIRDGDWELIVAGLRGRLDEARFKSIEEQVECLRIVMSILAGKLDLPSDTLVEMLDEALAGVRKLGPLPPWPAH